MPVKKLIIVLLSLISFEVSAQVADTSKKKVVDTVKKDILTAPDTVKKLHANPLALVPPAVLVTYGALSFPVHPIRRFDYYIHQGIAKSDSTFSTKAESYFQFAPVILVYGLNLVGIPGKNRFIDRTVLLGLSGSFLAIASGVTKHATHRLRPNRGDYLSFPSGHTATAFMGAEFMAQEYDAKSPLYGVVAYGIATTTGIFRLYNRDHWFSDVVAGAGFGILSTKLAYLTYPYIRNWLTKRDKNGNKKSMMLMPTYQDGVPGISFAKVF
jgi:membrane-associated phospholipid phosphatase